MTLTEFLLARIAEDEDYGLALAYGNCPGLERPNFGIYDPDRVLAECQAKQGIVWECRDAIARGESVWLAGVVLKQMAQPYAAHPDYQDWARDA